jgi:microcystin-dependent protein
MAMIQEPWLNRAARKSSGGNASLAAHIKSPVAPCKENAMSDPFIAEVRIFAGNFAPAGFAFCNGQLVPISQNTALFSIIGTTYGGDGRTTTALPNLQGRVPMHSGNGPGLTDRRLGEKAGTNTASLNDSQMPSHSHTLNSFADLNDSLPGPALGLGAQSIYATPGALVPMASKAVGETGGGQAHNNIQPILALNFIIALTGIFPSSQ